MVCIRLERHTENFAKMSYKLFFRVLQNSPSKGEGVTFLREIDDDKNKIL